MKALLKKYVDEFNANDDELYKNLIPNADAYAWLSSSVPIRSLREPTIFVGGLIESI